jgi:hypothetical protein
MFFAYGSELLRRLRRHNVIVAVKIERAVSVAMLGEQARGRIAFGRRTLTSQACAAESLLKKIGARVQVFSRRIFRGDSDQLRQEGSHFVFAFPQPSEKRGGGCCIAVGLFMHHFQLTMLGRMPAQPSSNLASAFRAQSRPFENAHFAFRR